MIEAREELFENLKNGTLVEHRHENIELKSDWAQDHGKKICMLANKSFHESWLVIGISDAGELLKKDENWARTTERTISQHINQYLDPVQTVSNPVVCREINGSWLIIISVMNPGAVAKWNEAAYSGSGTTLFEMSGEQILELTCRLPGLTDYSKQRFDDSYDRDLASSFLRKVSENKFLATSPDDIDLSLTSLRLNNTIAAHILFGKCPYRIVYYNQDGTTQKNETFYGLYGILKDNLIEGIQEWSRLQLSLHEKPYPEKALKEALANAVAHAAFFEKEGEIILEIYPEKIVVSNLCLPDAAYFANRWFSRSHRTVNAFLMETLRLGKFTDQLGLGKTRIFWIG